MLSIFVTDLCSWPIIVQAINRFISNEYFSGCKNVLFTESFPAAEKKISLVKKKPFKQEHSNPHRVLQARLQQD